MVRNISKERFEEMEELRIDALINQEGIKYVEHCIELGITDIEDEPLYAAGLADIMYKRLFNAKEGMFSDNRKVKDTEQIRESRKKS